jgi:hypothetical protein
MGAEPKDDGTQATSTGRPLASLMVIAAGLTRLVPHPWNLTPASAIDLFAGARLRSWHAFVVPIGVRVLTDVLLFPFYLTLLSKWYFYFTPLPFVYGSMAVNVLLGRRLLARTQSPLRIGACALLASVQFFVVSNFGSWLGSPTYPQTWEGLVLAYAEGLLYFRPTLLSTLVFTGVLFGAHVWLTRGRFAAERVAVPATKKAN